MSKTKKTGTKICKYCQSEIDANAKICPNCRKKQGGILKWVVIGVLVLGIASAAIGSSKNKPTAEKSNTNTTETSTNTAVETKDKKSDTDYVQSDVVTFKDVKYSVVSVEKTQGENQFCKPKDGKEYVKVTIKIENHSKEKISYNSLNWRMVNSNGDEDTFGTFTCDDVEYFSAGDLDAGGTKEGTMVWEQAIGDTNLRLRYYDNIFFDKNYTFQFKLD